MRGHRPVSPLPARDVRRDDRPVPGDRSADDGAAHRPGQSRLPVQRPARLRQDDVARASWPAASTAPRARPTPRAACARAASSSPATAAARSTSSRSTRRATTASTTPATCASAPSSPRRATATRSSSSTRRTWSRRRASTRCSRSSRSRRSTSSSSSRRPSPTRCIGTIRSRTHHYPFRLVPPGADARVRAAALRPQRASTVAPGVLPLVVRAGGGSVRDTLSLLDQLIAGSEGDHVDYERAVALLGYTHGALLDEVVDALGARGCRGRLRRGRPRHPDRPGSAPLRRGPARAAARPHRRRGVTARRRPRPCCAACPPTSSTAWPRRPSAFGAAELSRVGRPRQRSPHRDDRRHLAAPAPRAHGRARARARERRLRARRARPRRAARAPGRRRRMPRRMPARRLRCSRRCAGRARSAARSAGCTAAAAPAASCVGVPPLAAPSPPPACPPRGGSRSWSSPRHPQPAPRRRAAVPTRRVGRRRAKPVGPVTLQQMRDAWPEVLALAQAHEAQRVDGRVHRAGARVPRRTTCWCSLPERAGRAGFRSGARRAERQRAICAARSPRCSA